MGVTVVTLFRLGNASSPRIDHVRSQDVEMFDNNGETWVRAGTGGVSTSEVGGPFAGKWWRLDAGYDYGLLLLVWNDHGRHWSWEPAKNMRLAVFEAARRASHSYFLRV